MNKKSGLAILAVILLVSGIPAKANDRPAPKGNSITTRFYLMADSQTSNHEQFSMISQDGELVIHINPDTPIQFEDFVPLGDTAEGMTKSVRDVLFGQSLAQVLDGRKMTVCYDITTRSIPPQTSPRSVVVLFEDIMPTD